jgi:hypothetical protein
MGEKESLESRTLTLTLTHKESRTLTHKESRTHAKRVEHTHTHTERERERERVEKGGEAKGWEARGGKSRKE